METLHRILHPVTRVVDAAKGIVDYIASDETLDSYKEIVRAAGWRFTNFQKNAPFVDSHDTSTIARLCGKVIEFRVVGNSLIERVQWAIDVAENELALLGFKMTQAGYLKSVSVGFFPVEYLTPNSGKAWTDALAEMKLPADADVRTIYTQQEQVELSACVLGANPNALARARSDGLIQDCHLDKFPQLQRRIEKAAGSSRPTFSFPTSTATKSTSKEFMNKINIFARNCGVPTEKAAFDRLEIVRRDGTADEIFHAVSQTRIATVIERRNGGFDPIEEHLRQPGRREFWMALARFLRRGGIGKGCLTTEQAEALREMQMTNREFQTRELDTTPGGVGASFFLGQAMSQDIFDLLLLYGAFRTLGLRLMEKQFTKYAKITALPAAVFIPPNTQATTAIPADASASGSQLLPEANYVAALLNISLQLLEDNKVDFARLMVETFTQSLAGRIDYGCFSANGTVDANNGGQTGIFQDASISTFTAGAGSPSVAQLNRADFIGVVGKVASAALQRPCAWWIHPAFLPSLLEIAEANGARYILKTPAETGDGTWRLVGFPVNWTAQAPSTDGPGQKVAAFGHGDSYLVAMREEFELQSSPNPRWNTLEDQYRAVSRVFCETREATGLATLSTAQH
jgi:HK97 family phage major capsid protein